MTKKSTNTGQGAKSNTSSKPKQQQAEMERKSISGLSDRGTSEAQIDP